MSNMGVRIQEKGQVTIPLKIRNKLKLKRGDMVMFVETEEGVLLKPASLVVTEDLYAEVTLAVHAIRDQFKDYSVDEIESLISDAIRDAREKHR